MPVVIRVWTSGSTMADKPGVKFDNPRVILTIDTPVLCHFFRTILTPDFPGQDDRAK